MSRYPYATFVLFTFTGFVKVVVPSGECVGSNNMTVGTCTTPYVPNNSHAHNLSFNHFLGKPTGKYAESPMELASENVLKAMELVASVCVIIIHAIFINRN